MLRVAALEFSPYLPIMAAVLVVATFCQELIFRGYLLRNMVEVGRPAWGVVISSGLFVAARTVNPGFWSSPIGPLSILSAGVLLAAACLLSSDLWFPTGVHLGWNAVQGLLFNMPISGFALPGIVQLEPAPGAPAWLSGGGFGLEGSVLGLASTVVFAAILTAALLHRRGVED